MAVYLNAQKLGEVHVFGSFSGSNGFAWTSPHGIIQNGRTLGRSRPRCREEQAWPNRPLWWPDCTFDIAPELMPCIIVTVSFACEACMSSDAILIQYM